MVARGYRMMIQSHAEPPLTRLPCDLVDLRRASPSDRYYNLIIPCDRGLFNLFTVGITVAYTVLAMVMTVLMI